MGSGPPTLILTGGNRLTTYRVRALIILGLILLLLLALLVVPGHALAAIARGLLARRSLVAMLLLFALLALSLLWSAGQDIDAWIFLLINVRGPHPPLADRALWLVTQLGNGLTAAALALIALVTGYWRLAVEIVLGVISGWLIVETVKALAGRSRPYNVFEEARVVGLRAAGPSFPSGHTSQAFFLASLLSQHFHLATGGAALLYGLAALVGFSRMYVGAHYPRDVAGGLIVGWVWGTVAALVDAGWGRG